MERKNKNEFIRNKRFTCNLGRKSLKEIKEKLETLGLGFKKN